MYYTQFTKGINKERIIESIRSYSHLIQITEDGKVLIDNDSSVLKERRNMAANGYMEITVLISKNGQIKNNPIVTLKGIPLIEEDASEIEYDLEDVVMDTCKIFNLNNSKQEKNLIDTLKGNCRKLINEKSGKKPLVNINLVRL